MVKSSSLPTPESEDRGPSEKVSERVIKLQQSTKLRELITYTDKFHCRCPLSLPLQTGNAKKSYKQVPVCWHSSEPHLASILERKKQSQSPCHSGTHFQVENPARCRERLRRDLVIQTRSSTSQGLGFPSARVIEPRSVFFM